MNELLDIRKKYTFKPPFDVYNNDLEMTLVGLPDLAAMVAGLVDVFELIYKPVGLTKEDLNNDLRNSVKLMTFKVTSTDYLYVPQSYIADDVVDGVRMENKALIINLGAVLSSEDLDATSLAQDVASLVTTTLGIVPTYAYVTTSGVTHIPEADVSAYLAKRIQSKATEDSSYYIKYLRSEEERAKLAQKLSALEASITQ